MMSRQRLVYLVLSVGVVLAFVSTGVFYLFTLSPSPPVSQAPRTAETFLQEQPLPSSPSVQTTANPYSLTCYEGCEFTYQCPDDLECVAMDGIKRCINVECPDNDNCNCEAAKEEKIVEQYLTQTEDATMTAKALPQRTFPDLPRAGNSLLTYLILATALISSGMGLWLYGKK